MSTASTLSAPTIIPPALGPLANSHEADQVEADLKAAIRQVFEGMLRPKITQINTYGMAHLGAFETLERAVKADGLAMDRRPAGEVFMRELYRAWRARNPRRGTAFLRYYLRMLYPGTATVDQLWMNPAGTYPIGASPTPGSGWFLTSRVRVALSGAASLSEADVIRIRSVALSVLPARLVLDMYVVLGGGFTVGPRLAAVASTAVLAKFSFDAAP